jgi:septal ring factor EnvC (AmiA/AmiB activator)
MVQGTSIDKLELLKQELQHARAEQETHRALRKAEIDAEKRAHDEAARGRHEDTNSQLRAMRELLHEQRSSQAQQVEQMEQRHAEEARRDESTLRQMSDLQDAVTSLHDEQWVRSEQRAEERARAKAGGYPRFPMDVNASTFKMMMWFESKDTESVKKMSETVAETRDELLSIADGMNLVPLPLASRT